jgi:hypothetical protein
VVPLVAPTALDLSLAARTAQDLSLAAPMAQDLSMEEQTVVSLAARVVQALHPEVPAALALAMDPEVPAALAQLVPMTTASVSSSRSSFEELSS